MVKVARKSLASVIEDRASEIMDGWVAALLSEGALRSGRIKEAELRAQCRSLLEALRQGVAYGELSDITSSTYDAARELLRDISQSRAVQNYSPGETATFVFTLKRPIFTLIQKEFGADTDGLPDALWEVTTLVDKLGLYTIEQYMKSREQVIVRQQQEISELSTPVVRLWDKVIGVPLIGTLDSARTQVVMENLLQEIVNINAEIAIIDITGVPTVDTLVAQHLLKTVAATRLMGADCIISGVRPQIAQTLVHLGVELSVTSKATLADALALALERTGRKVVAKQIGA